MKPGIHPDYNYVMFEDTSTGDSWIARSTIKAGFSSAFFSTPHTSAPGLKR